MQFTKHHVAISTYPDSSVAFLPTQGASSQHSQCGKGCVFLVFHHVHSRAYCNSKQHICRRDDGRDDGGTICTLATVHSGGAVCIHGFHDPNGYRSTLRDYWKKDEEYHYSAMANRISRDYFLNLRHYLHFVDNSTVQPSRSPGYDKLGKARPIISMIGDCLATVGFLEK